jgi:hypothetical protein
VESSPTKVFELDTISQQVSSWVSCSLLMRLIVDSDLSVNFSTFSTLLIICLA